MGEKALRPQATELNRGLRRMVTQVESGNSVCLTDAGWRLSELL